MKTVVMTGATAGIGLVAAEQLRRLPDIRLIVGARDSSHADAIRLDLASLDSVRAFARTVIDTLEGAEINVLVLNAGVRLADMRQRTVDGHETAFAVNHLAHHLLLRLLLPHLSTKATVIITTSDLHDPRTNPYAPPLHADALRLAVGDTGRRESAARAALRAYASSKLCNILTAKALTLPAIRGSAEWRIIAFNPGITGHTGLTRDLPFTQRLLTRLLTLVASSPLDRVGDVLASLVVGAIDTTVSVRSAEVTDAEVRSSLAYVSVYRGNITQPAPSTAVSDSNTVLKLWRDSIVLSS